MRFSNSSAGGLGDQLPSGVVRVYARDARGQPQFVGEDRIGHTSAGSDLALKIGDAFDVTIEPTFAANDARLSRRATDYDMSYVVRNARSEADYRHDPPGQSLALQRGRHAVASRAGAPDADSFAWDVPVPANGETELTFTDSPKLVSAPRDNAPCWSAALAAMPAGAQDEVTSHLAARRFASSVTIYRDVFALDDRDADRRSARPAPSTLVDRRVVETLLPQIRGR